MIARGALAFVAAAAALAAPTTIAATPYQTTGTCAGFPRVALDVPRGWCVALVADQASGLVFPRRIVEVAPGRITARAKGPIEITIFKDGFFPIAAAHGERELTIDTAAGTFAHVSAGAPYPRAESVVNLQNAR